MKKISIIKKLRDCSSSPLLPPAHFNNPTRAGLLHEHKHDITPARTFRCAVQNRVYCDSTHLWSNCYNRVHRNPDFPGGNEYGPGNTGCICSPRIRLTRGPLLQFQQTWCRVTSWSRWMWQRKTTSGSFRSPSRGYGNEQCEKS